MNYLILLFYLSLFLLFLFLEGLLFQLKLFSIGIGRLANRLLCWMFYLFGIRPRWRLRRACRSCLSLFWWMGRSEVYDRFHLRSQIRLVQVSRCLINLWRYKSLQLHQAKRRGYASVWSISSSLPIWSTTSLTVSNLEHYIRTLILLDTLF